LIDVAANIVIEFNPPAFERSIIQDPFAEITKTMFFESFANLGLSPNETFI
jgi:hypothetical protein